MLFDLLDQMQKAIPTLGLTSHFEWPEIDDHDSIVLLPEEVYGIELVMLYAEQNKLMKTTELAKDNLKIFLKEVHGFIEYKTGKTFEGFDWFAATIFIICQGNLERWVFTSDGCESSHFQKLIRLIKKHNLAFGKERL